MWHAGEIHYGPGGTPAERDFWVDLAFRLGAEFDGLADPGHRRIWCDGLIPEEYLIEEERPRITGTAFLGASGQDRWRFVLFLRERARTPDEINWAAHLPPQGVTCWMSFDDRERTLEMDPAVARPDLM